jgi:hypothetical protein
VKKIDMHGIRHAKVADVLASACSSYETPFVVVTGKSILMKSMVAEAIAPFGLHMKNDITNPGRVVVYEKDD